MRHLSILALLATACLAVGSAALSAAAQEELPEPSDGVVEPAEPPRDPLDDVLALPEDELPLEEELDAEGNVPRFHVPRLPWPPNAAHQGHWGAFDPSHAVPRRRFGGMPYDNAPPFANDGTWARSYGNPHNPRHFMAFPEYYGSMGFPWYLPYVRYYYGASVPWYRPFYYPYPPLYQGYPAYPWYAGPAAYYYRPRGAPAFGRPYSW